MGLPEMWEVDLTHEGRAAWFLWPSHTFPACIGNKEASVLLCFCIPEFSVPYMLIVAFDSAQPVRPFPVTFQGAFSSRPPHPRAWTARGVSTSRWVDSGASRKGDTKYMEHSWVGICRNSVVLSVEGKMGLGARPCMWERGRILEVKAVKALLY